MLSSGLTIYAESPADEQAIESARQFIASKGLTVDDVRIVKKPNAICVITKREVKYGES